MFILKKAPAGGISASQGTFSSFIILGTVFCMNDP